MASFSAAEIVARVNHIQILVDTINKELALLTPLLAQLPSTATTDAVSSSVTQIDALQEDVHGDDFLSRVSAAFEIDMEWPDFVAAARDTERVQNLKPYIIYLADGRIPDRRVMMIIDPRGGRSWFASLPSDGSKSIRAPVHNIDGLDLLQGILSGDVVAHREWHKTHKVEFLAAERCIVFHSEEEEASAPIEIVPFARVVKSSHVLLDPYIVYYAFMCYSNAFFFAGVKSHPSFEATRCFDHNAHPLSEYRKLFFSPDIDEA